MKRYLLFSVLLLISVGCAIGFHAFENAEAGETEKSTVKSSSNAPDAYEVTGPKTVDVYLRRTYLNGQTKVKVEPATILSMEDFWSTYKDWEAVDQDENKVIFKKKIDDISPELKENGFFGISDDDILKIYKRDSRGKKAIQSFFQIDVKRLESDLYQKLQEGIPVESKGHYQQVIKQLEPYSSQKQ